MHLRKNLQDIYKYLISSDKLLRLLYYQSDPLSTSKPNIINGNNHKSVADKHIFWTPKTIDLTTSPTCRICLYPAKREPMRNNFLVSDQDFIFDVYAHIEEFDQKDLRLTWLVDEINDLVSLSRITGMGKVEFVTGYNIFNAPNGYVGYRLVYQFGSGN